MTAPILLVLLAFPFGIAFVAARALPRRRARVLALGVLAAFGWLVFLIVAWSDSIAGSELVAYAAIGAGLPLLGWVGGVAAGRLARR